MRQPKPVPWKAPKPDTPRPPQTCPIIDEAIDQIENIRKANAALRADAEYWQSEAEDYYELATQWEDYATDLAEKLEDAEKRAA